MAIAGDALIEAIDGPTRAADLEGKSMPVLTRFGDGHLGFRIMGKFAKEPPCTIVRVTLENGEAVRVSGDQIFLKQGMVETPAASLVAGDALEPSWNYRDGYRPPDLPEQRPADGSLRVTAVTPDGEGEVFVAPVKETGRFFLTCGALLKA